MMPYLFVRCPHYFICTNIPNQIYWSHSAMTEYVFKRVKISLAKVPRLKCMKCKIWHFVVSNTDKSSFYNVTQTTSSDDKNRKYILFPPPPTPHPLSQSRLPEQLPGGGSSGRRQVCATSAPEGGDETRPSAWLWICGRQWETCGGPLSHTR